MTTPHEILRQLALLPHTKVEFEIAGDHVRIRKAPHASVTGRRGQRLIELLRGTANTGLSTDEIMSMTRGES